MRTRAYPARSKTRWWFIGEAAAAVAVVSIVRGRAKAAQFEFKCGASIPADQPVNVALIQMLKAVEQESGGRLRIALFPNAQLGADDAMLAQVRLGALQFLFIPCGDLTPVAPIVDIANLGFAYRDSAEALRVNEGPVGNLIRRQLAAQGIYSFQNLWDGGMLQIGSSTRAIRQPDDLHGFKIRVGSTKIVIDLFKDLGASPTPIEGALTYTALQTKLIDGHTSPLVSLESHKFFEVDKYVSITNHAWAGFWLLVAGETWKSLPADIQAILERNCAKYGPVGAQLSRRGETDAAAQLVKQGVAVNRVDQTAFRANLGAYYREWATAFGSSAWSMLESSLGRKIT